MFFLKFLRLPLALFIALTFGSCVKDVDFDKAGEISLRPAIRTDLLFFELAQDNFVSPATGQFSPIVRDTVRLEFLDDFYIQKDLEQVELNFKYANTFPQSFRNKISFLAPNGRVEHQVEFYIAAGGPGNRTVTEWEELLGPDRIPAIQRSIQMVVEVEVLPNTEQFMGELNFSSMGVFSFEF